MDRQRRRSITIEVRIFLPCTCTRTYIYTYASIVCTAGMSARIIPMLNSTSLRISSASLCLSYALLYSAIPLLCFTVHFLCCTVLCVTSAFGNDKQLLFILRVPLPPLHITQFISPLTPKCFPLCNLPTFTHLEFSHFFPISQSLTPSHILILPFLILHWHLI